MSYLTVVFYDRRAVAKSIAMTYLYANTIPGNLEVFFRCLIALIMWIVSNFNIKRGHHSHVVIA